MPQPGGSGGMPGQAGSWDPNAAPPPPPAPAAGGQNQNLRKALGLGMKAYARGVNNVPAPDPNQPPTQFLPSPTPDNPGPPMPDALNRALSFQLGPFSMGAAAQYGAAAAPPMPNGQPGGSVPAGPFVPGQFGAHGAPNFGQNNPPPAPPAPPAPEAPVSTHKVGRAEGLGQAAPVLGPMLDAAIAPPATTVTHQLPDGRVMQKPVDDPTGVAIKAAATGATPGQAHAMHEPHQYSADEFADAVRGMPLGVLSKLWNFQHYLTPEQQLVPHLLGLAAQPADAAKKAYEDAVAKGQPQSVLDTLEAQHKAATNDYLSKATAIMFHNPWIPPQQ